VGRTLGTVLTLQKFLCGDETQALGQGNLSHTGQSEGPLQTQCVGRTEQHSQHCVARFRVLCHTAHPPSRSAAGGVGAWHASSPGFQTNKNPQEVKSVTTSILQRRKLRQRSPDHQPEGEACIQKCAIHSHACLFQLMCPHVQCGFCTETRGLRKYIPLPAVYPWPQDAPDVWGGKDIQEPGWRVRVGILGQRPFY
jgi:hypothetical protein